MVCNFNFKELIYNLLSIHPIFILAKSANRNLSISYYHIVGHNDKPHIKNLYVYKNIKEFNDDLDFLLKYYRLIDLPQLLDYVKNDSSLPKNSFLLTFDDGFREMEEVVAPILLKKGIPATFFINSAFLDNLKLGYEHKASLLIDILKIKQNTNLENQIKDYLKKNNIYAETINRGILSISYQKQNLLDQIAEFVNLDFNSFLLENKPYLTSYQINKLINNGFTIGAHSIDHPLYAAIPLENQLYQSIESIKYIRNKFKLEYGAFAFPHSDKNISMEFFQKFFETGLVDISFGTSGMMKDSFSKNLQRYSLEKPKKYAKKIVAFQTSRSLYKRLIRKGIIVRK